MAGLPAQSSPARRPSGFFQVLDALEHLFRWLVLQFGNHRFLIDLVTAIGVALLSLLGSLFCDPNYRLFQTLSGLGALLLPGLLIWQVVLFIRVVRHLEQQAAYEELRRAEPPAPPGQLQQLTQGYPLTFATLFTLLLALTLSAWNVAPLGPALRVSFVQLTTPLPMRDSFASFLNWLASLVPGFDQRINDLPGTDREFEQLHWLARVAVPAVFGVAVLAFLNAWFSRLVGRRAFVASLLAEPTAIKSEPYGRRSDGSPEPHEQVLLERAERIGNACLPHVYIGLSGTALNARLLSPAWQDDADPASERCRPAVAVLERVFAPTRTAQVWSEEPRTARAIAAWLL